MGYLKYKGYTGSVEYSEEDKCLFGKVQGLSKDSITYEGSTVEELTADFEGAIDDYLALCEENGIEPRKPYTGVLNVRLTPEIHSGVARAAQNEGITINAFIKNAVARALGMIVQVTARVTDEHERTHPPCVQTYYTGKWVTGEIMEDIAMVVGGVIYQQELNSFKTEKVG